MNFTIRTIWKTLTSAERKLVSFCLGLSMGLCLGPTWLSAVLVPCLSISVWQTVVFAYGRTFTKEWYKANGGQEVLIREVRLPLSPFAVCKNISGVSLYMSRVKD